MVNYKRHRIPLSNSIPISVHAEGRTSNGWGEAHGKRDAEGDCGAITYDPGGSTRAYVPSSDDSVRVTSRPPVSRTMRIAL